ncbi:MAG: hypothetical protein IKZ88_05495 [Neisseriaceae bacterium]|nr:hypothetical protein [Neisseriaceae bacterium]
MRNAVKRYCHYRANSAYRVGFQPTDNAVRRCIMLFQKRRRVGILAHQQRRKALIFYLSGSLKAYFERVGLQSCPPCQRCCIFNFANARPTLFQAA